MQAFSLTTRITLKTFITLFIITITSITSNVFANNTLPTSDKNTSTIEELVPPPVPPRVRAGVSGGDDKRRPIVRMATANGEAAFNTGSLFHLDVENELPHNMIDPKVTVMLKCGNFSQTIHGVILPTISSGEVYEDINVTIPNVTGPATLTVVIDFSTQTDNNPPVSHQVSDQINITIFP